MQKIKYVQMIQNRIQNEIAEWTSAAYVTVKELYRFLHNLKGTAGSIGLANISVIADQKLQLLQEGSNKLWPTKQWTEYLSLLFEELDLQQDSYSREVGGTGLGLAICQEIIDEHEGEIWIESEERVGTIIYFKLPLVEKTV